MNISEQDWKNFEKDMAENNPWGETSPTEDEITEMLADYMNGDVGSVIADDGFVLNMAEVYAQGHRDVKPDSFWFDMMERAIDNKIEDIELNYAEARLSYEITDEEYAEILHNREDAGINGDEPNTPYYISDKLKSGKTIEDLKAERKALMDSYFDDVKTNIKNLAREINQADKMLYMSNCLSYAHMTLAGNNCVSDFREALADVNPSHPFVQDLQMRKSPVVFDSMVVARKGKDLPWTDANNRDFNASIKKEYDRVKHLLIDKEDRYAFFDRIHTALKDGINGVKPVIYTSTVDYMDGYQEYQDEHITNSLKSHRGVDFSKPVINPLDKPIFQKSKRFENSVNKDKQTDMTKNQDGRGAQKTVSSKFEEIFSDEVKNTGHGDFGEN